jgi:tetratricopeptide (TPR) repeat protein
MGMEYLRTNHMTLAKHFLETAQAKSGGEGDPLACSELAVCSYQLGKFDDSIFWGLKALRTWEHVQEQIKSLALLQRKGDWAGVVEGVHGLLANNTVNAEKLDRHPLCCVISCQDPYWEPAISNIGHSFLKTHNYENAATCFREALRLCPEISSTCVSLGLAYQLLGDNDNAVGALHRALEVQPNHALANEMLKEAMKLSLARPFYEQFPDDVQGRCGNDEITQSTSDCDNASGARAPCSRESTGQDISLSPEPPTRFFKNLHTPHLAVRPPWHETAGVSSSADNVERDIRLASMVGEIQDDMFSTHMRDQRQHSNLSYDSADDVDMS